MADADAPGKLVVCGEYAVLDGAPAIAVAVAARARARVAPARAGAGRLSVPGVGAWGFDWGADATPRWREPPAGGRGAVLEAVAATLAGAGLRLPAASAIELDSREFQHADGEKLGLGSSAAITVALTAALWRACAVSTPADAAVFAAARSAHRRLQGGAGSGIDVAAAVYGGVVALAADGEVETLAWPAGLHWFAAWSGTGAATPPLLARFLEHRASGGAPGAALRARLRAAAVDAVAAWRTGVAATALAALAVYRDALAALDAAAGIGIVTPAHRRLGALAAAAGCLYKTSGAGGGDFGLVLAADAGALERAARAFAAAGVMTLAGRADAAGVSVR